MNTSRSRDVYVDRMHRVTAYIDQHLDQFLDLETLAAVAHFSPFHFHRLFSALMGKTLGAYLRRRRCEVAYAAPAQPRLAVLQIALAVGFSSAEAFTHAFSARFGCSPTAWRLRYAAARTVERTAISNPDQDPPGMRYYAIGYHPADCSSTLVLCLNTMPATHATILRREYSNANCAFP
jgi:AraC family transcriptional regulator